MELKSLHIHTVEALAGINESFITKLGIDGRRLVEDAQAYLKTAEDGPSKVAAENAELSRRVETLEAMIKDSGDGSDLATENAELKAKIAELEAGAVKSEPTADDGAKTAKMAATPQNPPEVDDKAAKKAPKAQIKELTGEEVKAETAATKRALKAHIKQLTGEDVTGNPSIKTLKKMLDEAKKD